MPAIMVWVSGEDGAGPMSGKAVWGPGSVPRWGLDPTTPRMISCFVLFLGTVGLAMGVRATEGACGQEAAYRDCVVVYNRMVAYEQRYPRAFIIYLDRKRLAFL